MPRFVLQIKQLGQPTRRVDLAGAMVVGREAGVDVQIRGDDLISRRHLRLQVRGELAQLEVLGTTNVTTVNDERIEQGAWTPLNVGDQIRIGKTLLVLEVAHLDTTHREPGPLRRPKDRPSTVLVPNLDVAAAAARSNAWLLLKGTSNRRRRSGQVLAVPTTVGSAADCEFVLGHESVAPRHAQLHWNGGHWDLTDLGSAEGTCVDGQRLGATPVPLRRNALVQFGNIPTLFVYHDPLTAADDARDESRALRLLVERQRLSAAEIALITNRTHGGHGSYCAGILMHETEVEPDEWVRAVLAARQPKGVLGRIGNKLTNWFTNQ